MPFPIELHAGEVRDALNFALLKGGVISGVVVDDAGEHRLTSKGRAQLEEDTANWAPLSEAIRLVLRTAQQGT